MALQHKLELHEGDVALHGRKQARQTSFFQRQLGRKEIVTQQLRVELDETKKKMMDLVREQKSAGRQLLVDKGDVDTERARLSQTMARQVSKMSHLWNTVRELKAQSKAKVMKQDASKQVCYLIFLFACICC